MPQFVYPNLVAALRTVTTGFPLSEPRKLSTVRISSALCAASFTNCFLFKMLYFCGLGSAKAANAAAPKEVI